MMHMTFYWGKQATILFDGWKTSTWLNFSFSLIALFVSSILLQYLANSRVSASSSPGKSHSFDTKVSLLGKATLSVSLSKKLLGSALFGVRVGLGYLLMLAVMSFNGGVFIAVVLGFAVGHFLFASESATNANSSTVADAEAEADACGCS
eukprot:c2410_g1_i1 orf=320-769(-)